MGYRRCSYSSTPGVEIEVGITVSVGVVAGVASALLLLSEVCGSSTLAGIPILNILTADSDMAAAILAIFVVLRLFNQRGFSILISITSRLYFMGLILSTTHDVIYLLELMVDSAIILAGGKGERLRPYTNDRPKVMVEINGKPILAWQIEWLKSHGIKKFVFTVSYKHEVVQNYFGDGSKFGVEIDYSVEETPLGRGGGIKKAFKSKLLAGEEDVIITNGDIISKANLQKMIELHLKNKAQITILLVPYVSRWGLVDVDNAGHVLGFREKPKLPFWINGGIYIFNREVEGLLPEVGDHEYETFPHIPKHKFFAFKDEGFWRAVDVVKDKSEAEQFLATGKVKLG